MHDRSPQTLGVALRVEVHGARVIDVEHAGDRLGALDVASEPIERFGDPAEHQTPSTQVSLHPPPCEELTTSDPSFKATRVRAAGGTSTSRP